VAVSGVADPVAVSGVAAPVSVSEVQAPVAISSVRAPVAISAIGREAQGNGFTVGQPGLPGAQRPGASLRQLPVSCSTRSSAGPPMWRA